MNFLLILSKGRILDSLIYFLHKNKIKLPKNYNLRKLYYKINKIYLIKIKNSDIKIYINLNLSDVYFIGKDNFFENYVCNFYKYYNTNISKSKLCLIKNKFLNNNNIIYTKYVNISKNFIKYNNLNFIIKNLNSSTELSLNLNLSCFIVDIISSYETLKINKLFEIENILNFNLIIILNRNIFYKKFYYKFFYKYAKYIR